VRIFVCVREKVRTYVCASVGARVFMRARACVSVRASWLDGAILIDLAMHMHALINLTSNREHVTHTRARVQASAKRSFSHERTVSHSC
jgi:hypothetical protein